MTGDHVHQVFRRASSTTRSCKGKPREEGVTDFADLGPCGRNGRNGLLKVGDVTPQNRNLVDEI